MEIVGTLKDETKVYASESIEGLKVAVHKASGKKCARCWNYFVEASTAEHPDICLRCVKNLESTEA